MKEPQYQPYTVNDVKTASSQNRFTVISCFAGGGGSSTGYRLAGGNILLINEFVEEAISSYKANYPDTPVLIDDIKKYKGEDFLKLAGIEKGELDILDGSPPCSAFSVAGKREKGWEGYEEDTRNSYFGDDGDIVHEGELKVKTGIKNYSDGKTVQSIEDLFLEFVRIAKDIQPKVIVAENVKGITFGEAKKKLNEFIRAFENIGYQVTFRVLNAADYGVPQARERTIFICVRDDVAEKIGLNFINLSNIFPTPTSKHVSMESAIDDIDNDPVEVQELRDFYENSFQKKFMDPVPFRPTRHTKPSDKEFREWNPKGSCFNMIRPCPTLPSPTLTQQGQKRGLSGVFHYQENRKLTILELKRLMSFPEDYVLTGTFDQQAERLGRAVAPKMMTEVANSIYTKILEPYYEKTNR
jgi:DNA (cytosine-5)-methyltransferase 1